MIMCWGIMLEFIFLVLSSLHFNILVSHLWLFLFVVCYASLSGACNFLYVGVPFHARACFWSFASSEYHNVVVDHSVSFSCYLPCPLRLLWFCSIHYTSSLYFLAYPFTPLPNFSCYSLDTEFHGSLGALKFFYQFLL